MQSKINKLLKYANKYQATDIHFVYRNHELQTTVRGINGINEINDHDIDMQLFNYLKYISNLDLGNATLPQSGNFKYLYKNQQLYFRFAFIRTFDTESAVLRILNNHKKLLIEDLSRDKKQNEIFKRWTRFRSGLILISGPTGSGKSTTLNAILEKIADDKRLKVVSLEDPIEIQSNNYLQFQINEKMNFTYQEGIKQLLRHDPDVIMIGEIRDEQSAKMLIRAALSGHMIFTTIHAKSCVEAISRLEEFGICHNDLNEVITGVTNQRIFATKDKKSRICVYEIMERGEIIDYFNQKIDKHQDIFTKIYDCYKKGWISKEQAEYDINI